MTQTLEKMLAALQEATKGWKDLADKIGTLPAPLRWSRGKLLYVRTSGRPPTQDKLDLLVAEMDAAGATGATFCGSETLAALTEDDWPSPDPYGVRLVEDEYGDVLFAPGHVDKETFARSVDHYDTEVCGLVMHVDTEPTEAEKVRHRWAVRMDDDPSGGFAIWWGDVTEQTPGAFPVTVTYRQ